VGREYNIPKIEIPLVIPSIEEDIKIRLNLLKQTNHKFYETFSHACEKKEIATESIHQIFKENKITIFDKLALFVLYSAEVEDKFDFFNDNIITKDQASLFIRTYELPFIRAKLAAVEILYKSDLFKPKILSYLVGNSDLYMRSDAFLNALTSARLIKHYASESKHLNNIFKIMGIDARGKKQKSQNFYMQRHHKNMVETGITMLRDGTTDEAIFRHTLNIFKLELSPLMMSQVKSKKMSASELSLEILTDSKIISSPNAYWDQTKSNTSSKMTKWIDCLFSHRITKEIMSDPILRSYKLWKPLESFYDTPHIWTQNPHLDSIQENYLKVFFKRHDEDAPININS